MSLFTKPTDGLHHNGKSVGVINSGDTQTDINIKIATELERITSLLKGLKIDGVDDNLKSSAIKNESSFGADDSYTETNRKTAVVTKANQNSIDVFYNVRDMLGADEELTSAKVVIEGVKNKIETILVDTKKASSTIQLNPDNFPATMTIQANVKTAAQTQDILSAKVTLHPEGESALVGLKKRNYSESNLTSQKDVNEFLFNSIKKINGEVKNEVLLENEMKSFQEVVSSLNSQIKTLKEEITSLKSK